MELHVLCTFSGLRVECPEAVYMIDSWGQTASLLHRLTLIES
jgi:hypothetical protein